MPRNKELYFNLRTYYDGDDHFKFDLDFVKPFDIGADLQRPKNYVQPNKTEDLKRVFDYVLAMYAFIHKPEAASSWQPLTATKGNADPEERKRQQRFLKKLCSDFCDKQKDGPGETTISRIVYSQSHGELDVSFDANLTGNGDHKPPPF